ncbi:ABC transporter substrate-binding protein [Cohnella fermenti]|nr:extracellular solute-binding protein [Cohnella fermenti]
MRKSTMKIGVMLASAMLLLAACSGNGNGNANGGNSSASPAGASSPAASSGTAQEGTAKQPVELTLAHGWTGEVAMAAAFEPAIDRFIASHDYITLNVETAPGNGIREKIVTEMAANDPPDVFLHWGARDTASYIANEKVADLTDLIAGDPELEGRYIDNAYDSVTYKGRIYGLPIEANMMNFLVNTKMFADAGIKVPETFDELKEAVKAFKAKGLIPIAANDGTTRAILSNLNDQLYGESVRDRLIGKEEYDERLVEAASHVRELVELGAFPEGMETLGTLQALELFNTGMSPMYYQHSWTLGSVAEDLFDQVEVVPFPKLKPDGDAYMTSGVGYFVYISERAYEDENKREAAWELAKYLAGTEVGKELEVVSGNPSPVVWDRSSDMHPMLAKAFKLRDSGEVKTFPDHNDLLSAEASKVYNDLKTRLYLNDITPEQYAQLFEEGIKNNPNPAFEP